MQATNQDTEKRLARIGPNTVHITVGKYEISRWSIEDSERFTDPLLKHMLRDGWDEKQAWLDSQGVPYEILTHSHLELSGDSVAVKVILLTTSENAVMFRLTFGE